MKTAIVLVAMVLMAGCTTAKKMAETDTPKGYTCITHGENPKSYKWDGRYFCTLCVNQNLGKVELVYSSVLEAASE